MVRVCGRVVRMCGRVVRGGGVVVCVGVGCVVGYVYVARGCVVCGGVVRVCGGMVRVVVCVYGRICICRGYACGLTCECMCSVCIVLHAKSVFPKMLSLVWGHL